MPYVLKIILKLLLSAFLVWLNYSLFLVKFAAGFLASESCEAFPIQVVLSVLMLIIGLSSMYGLHRIWRTLIHKWLLRVLLLVGVILLTYALAWAYAFDSNTYHPYMKCKTQNDCAECEEMKVKRREGWLD